MKEKIRFIVLLIFVIVVLIGIFVIMNRMNEDMEQMRAINDKAKAARIENEINDPNNNSVEKEIIEDILENVDAEKDSNVEVLEVTEANFDKEVLKSDKTVLIDFYADWCGPCKTLSPIVEEIAKENPDIKVVKVDVDKNESLSYLYNANYIPLLVVIKDGKEVDRAVGALPKDDILDLIK